MTLTVQDDTGLVAGANAYIDAADFKAHHLERGEETASDGTYSDAEIEAAIITASEYLDQRFSYKGLRLNDSQDTEWPRAGVVAGGYAIKVIPTPVKRATAAYALIELLGSLSPNPEYDGAGQLVRRLKEKVGPIEEETEYSDSNIIALPAYPSADRLLKQYAVSHLVGTVERA